MQAAAEAHPNIALIKYWGKRDDALNLPAAGSLSITLDTLRTRTRVSFSDTAGADTVVLNGTPVGDVDPFTSFVDLFRARAGVAHRVMIESDNNFPTAAGLASSASGFAALARACDAALGGLFSEPELSVLARRGSGSAARSIFGGFVVMDEGNEADGSDAHARPLLEADAWPLQVVVAVTSRQAKSDSSRDGMTASRDTSPFYADWVATTRRDLGEAIGVVEARDFGRLAELSEYSCLKMHATMLATRPGLVYWNGTTVDLIHRVRELRDRGLGVFFTIDAGPQLKAICLPEDADTVAAELAQVPGVLEVLRTGLGPGAQVTP